MTEQLAGMPMTPARAGATKSSISRLLAGMLDEGVPASILNEPALEKLLFLTKRYPKIGNNLEFRQGLMDMVLGGRRINAAGGPTWKNPLAIRPEEFRNPSLGVSAQQLIRQRQRDILPSESVIENFLKGGALKNRGMSEERLKKAAQTAEKSYEDFRKALLAR